MPPRSDLLVFHRVYLNVDCRLLSHFSCELYEELDFILVEYVDLSLIWILVIRYSCLDER